MVKINEPASGVTVRVQRTDSQRTLPNAATVRHLQPHPFRCTQYGILLRQVSSPLAVRSACVT
jgi:hypothetical protein